MTLLSSCKELEAKTFHVDWLRDKSRNVNSQFGEDGFIAASLERFSCANRWCFEVGAHDGIFFSNTKLLRDKGWNAVLIESDSSQLPKLSTFASDKVHVVHEHVRGNALDRILWTRGCPVDLDLGVIDIDGQDYWVWDNLRAFRPRLILVEFSIEKGAVIPEVDGPGQAPIGAILELGLSKGYAPLVKTHVNVLFCLSELLND